MRGRTADRTTGGKRCASGDDRADETDAAYADWRPTHSGRADRGPVSEANMSRAEMRVKQNSPSNLASASFCNPLKQLRLRVGTFAGNDVQR
jgi:hypothetical protein